MTTVKNPRRCEKCGRHIYSMYDGWQPIETAPKDGTKVLLMMGNSRVIGAWDKQEFHKHPKPLWVVNGWRMDSCRDNQPTHWMPIPAGPEVK